MEKIHELNVKTYEGEKEVYYGIDVQPPTTTLKAALKNADNEARPSDDVTYVVGYWTNGGCYTGKYHSCNYHRLNPCP